jgi:small GTP-binding protein
MKETPAGMRLHIGLFGRRNVGKTSLLNFLVGQDVGIVSDTPGTTTDVVTKPMELKPIGPVLLLDTAGMTTSANSDFSASNEAERRSDESTSRS